MPYLRRECDQVTRLPRRRHEILMVRQILAVREIGGALRVLARRDHLMDGDSDEGDRGSGLMVISVPGSL